MPRDIATNIIVRNRVRADLQLPFADPILPLADFEADTSEEALTSLRAAGLVPTRREAAETDRDDRRAAEELLIRPGVMLAITSGIVIADSFAFQGNVVGPVPLSPAVLEGISVNFNVAAVADGGTHAIPWAAFISSNQDLTLAGILADQNLIVSGSGSLDGITVAQVRMSGFTGQVEFFPVNTPINVAPAFLKIIQNVTGNVVFGGAVFHVRQSTGAILAGSQFIPVIPRFNLNVNTAPTRTRGTKPPVPRGAKIFVFQGGRIITERIVSWPALSGVMKARYFEQQLGAPADPSVQWIL